MGDPEKDPCEEPQPTDPQPDPPEEDTPPHRRPGGGGIHSQNLSEYRLECIGEVA